MGIEIEKKYRLTGEGRASLIERLTESGATPEGEEFEENTIYAGGQLDASRQVLRLRRAGARAVLTFKERGDSATAVKRYREDETSVGDAAALADILIAGLMLTTEAMVSELPEDDKAPAMPGMGGMGGGMGM